MKKFLVLTSAMFSTILLTTNTAFAFGGVFGGGGGHSHTTPGVDAIGVHQGGGSQVDVNFDTTCSPSDHKHYNESGVCVCDSGFEDIQGTCISCPNGLAANTDKTCTICTNGNIYLSYMDNPCETDAETFTGCKSNKNCETEKYCNLSNVDFFANSPNVGTCTPLDNGVIYTYNNKTFLKSETPMSWWIAYNWCKAKGKKMVSLSSMGINKNSLGTYFNTNGFCSSEYGSEATCENVNWIPFHDAFLNTSESSIRWWTQDNYSSDLTRAYYLQLFGVQEGEVGHTGRGTNSNFYALCE